MNARFWKVLGYNPAEMPHNSIAWQKILNQNDLKLASDNLTRHCENPDHPYDQVVRYTHKDGSTVWIRCRGIAIRDKNGKPVRMLGAHQDISDIKRSEQELVEAKEKAEESDTYSQLKKNEEYEALNQELQQTNDELLKANTERRQAENALRESEMLLRQVIDLVPHFIFSKDVHGTYLLANKAIAEVYGTTPENLLGKSDYDFAHNTEEVEFFIECDKKVIESGIGLYGIEEPITDTKGSRRFLETNKIPFITSGTKTPALLAVSVDITERKLVETQLVVSEQRLKEAQHIAHLGNWDLCIETNELYWSDETFRIFDCDPQEFKATYEAFLEFIHFKPEAEAKGMRLYCRKPLPAKEAIIKTDREKVYAILANLVKNAIKYSEKGSIEMGYDLNTDSKPGELVFYVKDNGIGIPKDRQEAIFDRFVQADVTNKMAHQGAGKQFYRHTKVIV